MSEENLTLPDVEWPILSPFWKACKQEELKFPFCTNCKSWQWYPLYSCPTCGGNYNWEKVSEEATLFSWTVIRRSPFPELAQKVPFIVGVLEIDDAPGVRFVANIEGCEQEELQIGMKLSLFFEHINDEVTIPKYRIRE